MIINYYYFFEDIDECASEINVSPCPIDTHFCVNTEGSYACHKLTESKGCPAGFKFNVTKKICQGTDLYLKVKRLGLII